MLTLIILAEWTCEGDFYKGFQVVSPLFHLVLLASSSSSTASSCWTSCPDSSREQTQDICGKWDYGRGRARPLLTPAHGLTIPCERWGVDLLVWDMSDRCCSRTNFLGLFSCWFHLTVAWEISMEFCPSSFTALCFVVLFLIHQFRDVLLCIHFSLQKEILEYTPQLTFYRSGYEYM